MSRIELRVPEPLETASVLGVLAAHAVPGLEEVDAAAGTVRRLLAVGDRRVAVTLRFPTTDGCGPVVVLEHDGDEHLGDAVASRVRRWLDLDADLAPVRAVLCRDPRLAPLVRARPGLRVTGYVDGFEGAVLTVLGQQVSLAAARTVAGRLLARYADLHSGTALRPFPAPQVLASVDPDELREVVGIPRARAGTVVAVAGACAEGLSIEPDTDHGEVRAALLALPGVGPWTVDYLALRALGDRDALPATDLVLRRALGGRPASEVTRAAAAWSPYRAYATEHLWGAEGRR